MSYSVTDASKDLRDIALALVGIIIFIAFIYVITAYVSPQVPSGFQTDLSNLVNSFQTFFGNALNMFIILVLVAIVGVILTALGIQLRRE